MQSTNAALVEARAALDTLPRTSFTELMAYRTPPKALVLVCCSALLAVGMPEEHEWVDVQRGIVSEPVKFKRAVLALDPVDIDSKRRAALSKRLAMLAKLDVSKASRLGGVLEAWLNAVVSRK